MADEPTTRDLKLIQYLNEAYGKEKQLERALKDHIKMTTRDAYKKRLREHLQETQQHAKDLSKRIKQLGGKAEELPLPGPDLAAEAATKAVAVVKKGAALAEAPLHAIRGTGEAEKLLKNAKTELKEEYEEIANYLALEEFANAVKDADTAKLARQIRRQEERMATFLQRLIPQLSKLVAREEVPAAERRGTTATTARRTSSARSTARASSSNGAAGSGRTARTAGASRASGSSSRASGSSSRGSGSSSRASGSSSSGGTRSTARRSSGSSSSRRKSSS